MNLSIINQLTHFDEDHFDEKHLNDINNFQLNKTPKQIKDFLDQYVIGQDIAK
jgi:ATP-dependent protease Clp ATPase subunit